LLGERVGAAEASIAVRLIELVNRQRAREVAVGEVRDTPATAVAAADPAVVERVSGVQLLATRIR
jgi:hypothetical protein